MGLMFSRRANLERALRRAIHDDQIEIYYQPLIDLKGGRIVAFEALARWDHPDLGDVPPSSFIQIAEDFGLITPLSDLLLRKACREAVRWPSDITLAFNISATQLRDKLLGLRILGILADTGLSPHRLEIEITESAVVKEYKAAQLIIDELRAAGIRISLDDFGTGYSSLSQLSHFKFDQIKIDSTFIKNMLEDGDQAMLVKAVIGLGRGLGLATVGEGIENPNQLAFLREAGCELGQGFLFSKAVPAEETLRLTLKKDGTTPAHKQARA